MKNIIITIFIIITGNLLYSQSLSDRELILGKIISSDIKDDYYDYIENTSTMDHAFSSIFFIYKTFVSSQDGSVCSFHPSCSEYGVISIKEYGLFKGVLKTSDRFLRCNGFSPEKYDFIIEENLLYDPVL
tara:strand:- start:1301 stop:1690 length:390 start_codon:yes stop_codon:yes gene_type:complete